MGPTDGLRQPGRDSTTGRDAAIKKPFKLFTFFFSIFNFHLSAVRSDRQKGTEIETKSSSTASCGSPRLAELCFERMMKRSYRFSQGLSHFQKINAKFGTKLMKDLKDFPRKCYIYLLLIYLNQTFNHKGIEQLLHKLFVSQS